MLTRRLAISFAAAACACSPPPAPTPMHVAVLCDTSTSSSTVDVSCSIASLRHAATEWFGTSDDVAGSTFVVWSAGRMGAADADRIFEARLPDAYGPGGYQRARRDWQRQTLERLSRVDVGTSGSAIVESISRIVAELRTRTGRRRLLIHSDMRQSSPRFDGPVRGERVVEFARLAQALPSFADAAIDVRVCGVHGGAARRRHRDAWSPAQAAWLTVAWSHYFAAAGAPSVTLSPVCDVADAPVAVPTALPSGAQP